MTLQELLGNNIQNVDGSLVNLDSLKGKVVGLYFSASWCGPCHHFTPVLKEWYNKLKTSKPLEIIFVSSDRDDKAFKEYRSEMPWLALDFADRERKGQLSSKFKVSGIPTLVFLNDNGELTNKDGRSVVNSDPEGNDYPWIAKTLKDLLSPSLTVKNSAGAEKTFADIQANTDAILLYFSAHWCPPCKMFTPELTKTYNKMKEANKRVECIFISSDKSQAQFDEYLHEMPWYSTGYEAPVNDPLNAVFEIEGIPTLVVLDSKNLKTITMNGRGAVSSDSEGLEFPWYPKAWDKVSRRLDLINDVPILIALTDKMTPEKSKQIIDTLGPVAEKFVKSFGESEPPMSFSYGVQGDELVERIRGFANVKDEDTLILLDIPSGNKYCSSEELSVDSVESIVNKFLKKELSMTGIRS